MDHEAVDFLENERGHRIAEAREFITDPAEWANAVERIDAEHHDALRRLAAVA